jgi:hypothetical protein
MEQKEQKMKMHSTNVQTWTKQQNKRMF